MPRELPAGTEIICPHCQQVMAIAKTTITEGTRLGPDAFHQVGYAGARGDRAVCPHDGTPFIRQSSEETERQRMMPDYVPVAQIFTREGWQ